MENLDRYIILNPEYKPNALTWHSVKDCLPALESHACFDKASPYVLTYNQQGDDISIGFLVQWDDEPIHWKEYGRDYYNLHGVTHWRWLPQPPTCSVTYRCTYDDICGLLDAKDAEIAALKACVTGLTDLVRYVVHDSFCIAPGHKSECSTGCLRCAMEAVLAAQREKLDDYRSKLRKAGVQYIVEQSEEVVDGD